MKLAERVLAINPSPTLAIDAKAKAMKKQGFPVIGFGVGEPDFDTPENIKQAAIKAVEDGFTKYTAVAGIDELKEAICAKMRKDNNLVYQPNQVIVSAGAKHSLYNTFQVLCEEGDEVILPAPYWVSYWEQIKLAGGKPVIVQTKEENGFKLTAEQLRESLTEKTKILLLNSPSNPTGAVYSREELLALGEVILEKKLIVISDEIYEKLVYTGEHISIASLSEELKEQTIIINGLSKGYSMTGWRVGYAVGPKAVIAAMTRLQSHATSNAASICQKAAVEALLGPQDSVASMKKEFRKRRDYMVERLNKIPDICCYKPQGAFYVFPNISALLGKTIRGKKMNNSADLADLLLEESKVALVPGVAFGVEENVRLSYATSMEQIKEGLDRIENILQEAE